MDLSKLTKAQKLELVDLLAKKKEAAKRNRPTYIPNAGQLPIHESKMLQRFAFSGNGAGKSAAGAHELMWAALGYNPILKQHTYVPSKVYCVLDKPEKVDSVLLPEIRKWFVVEEDQLHKDGKPYVSRISFKNGSFIKFVFHDQADLTAEGIESDFVLLDEPPPRHLYIGFRRSGRAKGRPGRILFTGTPLAAPWLRTEIYEPWSKGELDNVDCFKFNTEVNRNNLADGYIEDFSKSLTEKEKAIRLAGDFFDIDGSALADVFKRDKHIVDDFEWGEANPVVIAIDPHMSKPHHAVMLGVNKENQLFVIKELKVKGPAAQFAEVFKEWTLDLNVIDIVCDSLGSTPQSGGEGFLSFIQVLRKNNIMLRSTSYNDKNDEDWIDRIKTVLRIPLEDDNFGQRHPKLRIFRSCGGLIRDIETVQWLKVRNEDMYKPKLDISNKDFLSCLKYALASNLSIDKPTKKPYYKEQTLTSYGRQPTKWQRLLTNSRLEWGDDET